MKENMTNREFYKAIANGMMNDEIKTHALEQLEKLNARNAKRATTPTAKQRENEEIKKQIFALVGDEPVTAAEIADALNISRNKVSALCTQIVNAGRFKVTEVKGKSHKVNGYTRV